ncbi:DUF2800 domain-containing protein [Listeria monocytogenes]|nr:DUF2800 domain-containing protein [Listeria monocytogenes]ECQ6575324.1 DUF2800 domain-containing protein [Listeria monocytogenes]EGY1136944.1 DUF2800 domain-containing protein [Listeria monocytogenes]EHE4681317.1 DUF2800 domain-containing protein [Listeria monocytogenes]EHT4849395.1 DUF2800 domain-containing protein [Listeria monocytogenes]
MPSQHALLSASSSSRWINCPPSARLAEQFENKTSEYAAQGTDAHSLCEYKLQKLLGNELEYPELQYYDEEMEECSEAYATYIMGQEECYGRESYLYDRSLFSGIPISVF